MTGVSMKERATVGSRWVRNRDKTRWVIRQSYRSDRLAKLVPDGEPAPTQAAIDYVPFGLLRTRFTEVKP